MLYFVACLTVLIVGFIPAMVGMLIGRYVGIFAVIIALPIAFFKWSFDIYHATSDPLTIYLSLRFEVFRTFLGEWLVFIGVWVLSIGLSAVLCVLSIFLIPLCGGLLAIVAFWVPCQAIYYEDAATFASVVSVAAQSGATYGFGVGVLAGIMSWGSG